MEKLEHHWDMAKEQAAKEGRKDDYAYITGILKKSLKIKSSTLATQLVAAMKEKDELSKVQTEKAFEIGAAARLAACGDMLDALMNKDED